MIEQVACKRGTPHTFDGNAAPGDDHDRPRAFSDGAYQRCEQAALAALTVVDPDTGTVSRADLLALITHSEFLDPWAENCASCPAHNTTCGERELGSMSPGDCRAALLAHFGMGD